jgi:3(or 17)beta-hydroxysteroid dehydrogenase
MNGRVALITGGASGMGAEDARILAREGAQVIISDMQEELGRKVAAEIPGAEFLHHDVRDEARWKEVIANVINRFGRLDVLVNNAGLVRFGNIEDISVEDARLQLDVVLFGTFLGCKTAIPAMSREGAGSIINIASTSALKGMSIIPAYSAAKGGIVALTRSLAVHCQEKGYGIRVNSICPGAIDTPMMHAAASELPSGNPGLEQAAQLGMGKPSDIANMVLYLASDEGRHINGANIDIDNAETIQ